MLVFGRARQVSMDQEPENVAGGGAAEEQDRWNAGTGTNYSGEKYALAHAFSADIPRMTRFVLNDTATTEIYTLSLHDALPI